MPDYTAAQVAQLCWNSYYRTELTGVSAINEYLTGEGVDYTDHDNTFDNLVDALYDDIRDLLHNGNQEDLFGSTITPNEADKLAELLHDGWQHDPNPLEQLCEELAKLVLATIITTTGPKED
jgi:hypothetical protein